MATLSQIFGILDLDLIGVFDFPSLSSEDSVIGDQCLFGFVSFRAFIRAFGAENVTRLTGGKRYSGAPLYTHVVSLTFTRGLLTGWAYDSGPFLLLTLLRTIGWLHWIFLIFKRKVSSKVILPFLIRVRIAEKILKLQHVLAMWTLELRCQQWSFRQTWFLLKRLCRILFGKLRNFENLWWWCFISVLPASFFIHFPTGVQALGPLAVVSRSQILCLQAWPKFPDSSSPFRRSEMRSLVQALICVIAGTL